MLVAREPERAAARQWLATLEGLDVREADGADRVVLTGCDLLWLHDVEGHPPDLESWLAAGGRILATLASAGLATELGLEPAAPDDRRDAVWRHAEDEFWLEEYRSFEAFPHIRGLAAFGPHPLFAGMDQGTFVWAPSEGEPYHWMTYRAGRPQAGAVVAVERSFIHLNSKRAVAWEHRSGDGGILALGAFVHLAAPDQLLGRQLRAVLANALTGEAIPHRDRPEPVAHWPAPAVDCRRERVAVPQLPDLNEAWTDEPSPLRLHRAIGEDEPWTLAGRRTLLVGGERSGLAEVWTHPFRLMQDASLEHPALQPGSISVSPSEIRRELTGGTVSLIERWTCGLELPVVIGDFAPSGPGRLEFGWTVDLRRMWPYPAGAFGDLRWSLSDAGDRLWVGASGGSVQAVYQLWGGTLAVAPARSAPAQLRVRLEAEGACRLVALGAVDSTDLASVLGRLGRKRLAGIQAQRARHADMLHQQATRLHTPEPELDLAFEWAKVRADSFVAETPGIGRSLLAGYARSTAGWGDGRPGYAWYFGRDACWTAFAQLAAGDREGPREALRFLSRTQDVTGKVLHEYTTSGLVHYDAADSTPLYLLLATRFAAWTGDLDYLRRFWPAIERAYHFCLETDRDGDGLIENRRVGHGWIEHGPLGGAAVTLYLAACWTAALEALEPVAEALGHPLLAAELQERAGVARRAVAERFHLPEGGWALGLRDDGSPEGHLTAMLAVPLLLGVIPPESAGEWLDAMAGEGFSAAWGVRMVATDDPLFQPTGYHRGAVWPLYTGWVSLAEWHTGRWSQALRHLRSNARMLRQRALGAFDEVLHGAREAAGGVCPDQAWSAAMMLSPVVEGLWGVRPDALNAAVRLAPWLPPEWPSMSLQRLRIGRSILDLELRRTAGGLQLSVVRNFGPSVLVEVEPRGAGAGSSLLVDGESLTGGRVRFQADDRHEVLVLSP